METFEVREVETLADLEAKNVDAYLDQMLPLLKIDGVRFPNNKEMRFTRLEPVMEGRECDCLPRMARPESGWSYANQHEVGSLRRILKWAKLWHVVGLHIKPLKEPDSIGRALTFAESTRLFHIAAQKRDWETAYWAATVAVSTTARSCALRALHWRNVDFTN
jgi:hypothetical protein